MSVCLVFKVLIVGGGIVGWMIVVVLSKFILLAGVSVEFVECDVIGMVGVGEVSIFGIVDFNCMLGILELDFIVVIRGSFKFGIEFVNWGVIGESYLYFFGDYGFVLQGEDFYYFWNCVWLYGDVYVLEIYLMCCMVVCVGKFMLLVSDL